jgi:4-hydroxybenzoate polyprenyltransferase
MTNDKSMNRKSTWFVWAQLVRVPNVFTVVADVTMGFLFVSVSLRPISLYLLALFASIALYWAGMVLNDVCDYEQDSRERPERPLPSGRIDLRTAKTAGWGLLLLGIVLASLAGLRRGDGASDWLPAAMAGATAFCVVAYDRWLKSTPLGPPTMGACRFFNILLAMACGGLVADGQGHLGGLANSGWGFGFDASQLVVAAAIGVYIAGVTWFARSEAHTSNRGLLLGGLAVIVTGLGLLSAFPSYGMFATDPAKLTFANEIVWPLLVALLGISIVRRCLIAIANPEPAMIQTAVKQSILSLIFLDAAVCLAVRWPPWWAVGIILLLVPTLLLGRVFYST